MHVNLPTRIHRASSIKMIKMQKCFIFFIVLFFYCFLVFSPLLFFWPVSGLLWPSKISPVVLRRICRGWDEIRFCCTPLALLAAKLLCGCRDTLRYGFSTRAAVSGLSAFFFFLFSFFFTSNLLTSRTLCGVVTPISPLVGINLWPISLRLFSSPESHCCRKLVAKVAASTLEKAEFSRDRQAW